MKQTTIGTQGRQKSTPRRPKAKKQRWVWTACALLLGAWGLQSCEDEVLTGQPEWLGNSIYDRLKEDPVDKYSTLLRLIDDLDQKEVLSHTGSKTLFAANDQAFETWFKNNTWTTSSGSPVRNYSDLSLSQKKLLLNNTMINNAYLVDLLSNVSGTPPMEGRAMRRETAASIYDSVYVMPVAEMPTTDYWAALRSRGKSIPMMMDATAPTVLHFLPAFMSYYNMTAEDLALLTNHKAQSIDEAWMAGVKVLSNAGGDASKNRNITCKNGYIHKVDAVIEPTANMAEIIRQDSQTQLWSRMLDRYSTPVPASAAIQREYNRLYDNSDSVFVKRYFSRRSAGSTLTLNSQLNSTWPEGNNVKSLLKFDPGWNQYIYSNTMDYDLHYDAGAMLVPTDAAVLEWWNGEGRELQEEYQEIDSIPLATLVKLINVNMMETFTSAFPSNFADKVLNDAKEPLGVTKDNIVECKMGSNGVVYKLNKLFGPAEYSSVAYPALAHESTMNVIYWAISTTDNDHKKNTSLPYLLSMDTKYSMLLPTNEAMKNYIDPATYGLANQSLIEFYLDPNKNEMESMQGNRYTVKVEEDGTITKVTSRPTQTDLTRNSMNTRLDDLMNQLIIVGDIEDGHEYYKTKGGCLIRVFRTADDSLAVAGGWQVEHQNQPLKIKATYPKKNGKAYQLDTQPPLGSSMTVLATLQAHPEYSLFADLLNHDGSGMLSSTLSISADESCYAPTGMRNFTLLDNYNYTVYVPTNESIQELIDQGLLPTWEDYDNVSEAEWGTEAAVDSVRNVIKQRIINFIRYHVQDHSVAVDMAPESGSYQGEYESMMRNPETGRFFPFSVDYSSKQLTVQGQYGPARHVVKSDGLYNNICREYWFTGRVNNNAIAASSVIFMASNAVVHQIDGPLLYEKLTNWKTGQ